MAAGDDRYLPVRDKGPQRKFVRDFIDSGWHIGEAVMPAMVLVILATFIPVPAIQYYSFIGLWIFILFVIGDMIIASIRVKQAARKKFGADRIEKGLGWYGAMRIIQMRFMRLPKAQVKRGQHPDRTEPPSGSAGSAASAQPAVELARPQRPAVEERRVALHEGGTGIQSLAHVRGRLHAARGDHDELRRHDRAHEAEHVDRTTLQRRAGQSAVAGRGDDRGVGAQVRRGRWSCWWR